MKLAVADDGKTRLHPVLLAHRCQHQGAVMRSTARRRAFQVVGHLISTVMRPSSRAQRVYLRMVGAAQQIEQGFLVVFAAAAA